MPYRITGIVRIPYGSASAIPNFFTKRMPIFFTKRDASRAEFVLQICGPRLHVVGSCTVAVMKALLCLGLAVLGSVLLLAPVGAKMVEWKNERLEGTHLKMFLPDASLPPWMYYDGNAPDQYQFSGWLPDTIDKVIEGKTKVDVRYTSNPDSFTGLISEKFGWAASPEGLQTWQIQPGQLLMGQQNGSVLVSHVEGMVATMPMVRVLSFAFCPMSSIDCITDI